MQRLALICLVSVTILVFVGAIVRVTGAGLGCPDWPTCWGQLIPPWKAEQVDPQLINVERFKRKAQLLGRDPDEITIESLMAEFNPVHTWTEFINRLFALPVMLSSLALLIAAMRKKDRLRRVRVCAVWSFVLVLANAIMGAAVVYSGLKTGIITTHLALAFILLFLLTYIVWAGGPPGSVRGRLPGASRGVVGFLLLLILIEGLLGAQIREMTDSLQRQFGTESRPQWIEKIDDSWLFLVHRSFSWAIFAVAAWAWWQWKKAGAMGRIPMVVMGIMVGFLLMGLFFSHVTISAWVQVLHVGLASVLGSTVFYWWLAAASDGSKV